MRTFNVLALAVLMSGLTATAAIAQQRPLRGTVNDAQTGQPIGAVQIRVRGTTVGTITGADGKFSVNIPDGPQILDVRRIGYQATATPVTADANDVTIALKADVLRLNQEVITGQATTVSRANSANDVGSVSAQDLTQAHAPTLDNALQGKVAGVEITANSGAPGGGMQIRMRGVTSIYGNSQPLYVVDGLPVSNTITTNGLNAISQAGGDDQDNSVNRIADLNPNDIENIEVLKGPSAAAIYGSSAANGVVVITTKRGQVGRPRFSFTQQFGTHTMENTLGLRKFNLADATAFAAPYGISADTVQAWFNRSGGFNDFEKEVYGDRSLSYSSNLSVSGGSQSTRYFLSGLAMHDNGIQYNSGYDKQSVRANLTQLVGSRLQIQVNTNLIHTLTKRGISNNDNVNVSPYVVFAATPTFFSFEPVNGVYPVNPFLSNGSNPLQTIALLQTPEDLFRFMGSVNAQYTAFTTATQSLKATLDLSIDHYGYQSNLYSPPSLYWEPADGFPGTTLQRNTGETRAPIAVTLAHTYTAPGNSLQATTSAGVRRGYDDFNQLTVTTTDLLAGQQNVDRGANVGAAQNRQTVQTLALYGQEDLLLLDQRLFVSGGVVAQRSTNNADVNKFFYYPKAAASYRFTNVGPFTELKLRAAYGETGNEPLYGNKFGSLVGATYAGQNGVQIGGNVADPNLHPEREKEFETGVDLGLLNSRLAVSGTFYQKTNSDLLLQARLAPSTGFGVRVFNGGEIRNRGVEATITGFPLQQKDLSWQMGLTFSKNVGKVMSLPAGLGSGFAPPGSFALHFGQGFIAVGQSPSQITGIDSTNPGVRTTLGDYEPDYIVGLSNEINVGPVRLYGLLDWHKGGDAVNLTQLLYDGAGLAQDVAASTDRITTYVHGNSPYIQSTTFVKLREVTLSYRVPESFVHSILGNAASGLRLEASGRNLITWTKYKGLDPEVSNFGDQNINRSQDVAPYPPARTFMFTLGVDF